MVSGHGYKSYVHACNCSSDTWAAPRLKGKGQQYRSQTTAMLQATAVSFDLGSHLQIPTLQVKRINGL